MANFEVPENPEFTQELRKLESTDLAHADTFNPLFQTLLNNTVSLFKKIGSMAKVATSGSYIDLLDKPDIPTVPSSIKNPYKWKANGKVYDGSSEQDMGTLEVAYGGTGATTAEDARENLGLGSAATQKVANNDTTTAEGYLADARIVRQHGIEIDQINSDLMNLKNYCDFSNKIATITSDTSNKTISYTATDDCYVQFSLCVNANTHSYAYINDELANHNYSSSASALSYSPIRMKTGDIAKVVCQSRGAENNIQIFGVR